MCSGAMAAPSGCAWRSTPVPFESAGSATRVSCARTWLAAVRTPRPRLLEPVGDAASAPEVQRAVSSGSPNEKPHPANGKTQNAFGTRGRCPPARQETRAGESEALARPARSDDTHADPGDQTAALLHEQRLPSPQSGAAQDRDDCC